MPRRRSSSIQSDAVARRSPLALTEPAPAVSAPP